MNKIFKTPFLVFYCLILALTYPTLAMAKPIIEIENLRVILPPSVARTTAIYGVIKNTGDEDDTLLEVSSNLGKAMLHQTTIDSGQAQMNHIDNYVIKAGDALSLKPMSYHIMIVGIDHKMLRENNKVSLKLEFEKQGELVFNIPVLLD